MIGKPSHCYTAHYDEACTYNPHLLNRKDISFQSTYFTSIFYFSVFVEYRKIRASFIIVLKMASAEADGVATVDICFVCEQMARRRPRIHQNLLSQPTSQATNTCILCARPFCQTHKSKKPEEESVCEINHWSYHLKHPEIPGIFPTIESREQAQH
jgi:hypothetical protein